MVLNLPKISKLIYESNNNEIWQYFMNGYSIDDVQIVRINPFIIKSGATEYLLTIDKNNSNENYDHILLTAKKPTRNDLDEGKIRFKRWLKHPEFKNHSPEEVLDSWSEKFKIIKENEALGIKGFRPPQLGALHSILAHLHNSDDKAIIVMPTGTGKTETMLATLVSSCCRRLLVSVPSDSLRTQISDKFITLGLLKEFGIVDLSVVQLFFCKIMKPRLLFSVS